MAAMPNPKDVLAGASARWSNLTPPARIAAGAVVALILAAAFFLTRPGPDTEMIALYSDMSPADAAAVVEALEAEGVPSELADGGATVLVNREQVYDLRVDLAGQGLPASGDGFDLLDEQGITTSEFRQRTDYQRAIQGELATTITALDGVSDARVLLTMPRQSVFADEDPEAKASVLVTTDANTPLSASQVQSVVHLVAGSVEGLTPADVVVSDQTGAVLSGATSEEGAMDAASADLQTRSTTAIEQQIATSLTSIAAPVTGPDAVQVQVRAQVNYDVVASTDERFNPEGLALDEIPVTAESVDEETYTGGGPAGEAVLGPDGAPIEVAAGNTNGNYSSTNSDRTFAVDRSVTEVRRAPSVVERLNVAVVVDEDRVDAEAAEALEETLATAAGLDEERGDTISVARLAFDTTLADEAAEAAEAAAEEEEVAEDGAATLRLMITAGIAVLVLLIAAIAALRSRRRTVVTEIDLDELNTTGADTDDDGTPTETALANLAAQQIVPPRDATRELVERASTLADEHPEVAAQTLSALVREPTRRRGA